MDTYKFHSTLLRPAVLQILRAAGFHSARPNAVEALTDITSLYLRQLCELSASHAATNHNESIPDVTDVRMAMAECGVFGERTTPAQEAWKEVLRKPLAEYSEKVRESERVKRDAEDTSDIRGFIDWITGPKNKEIGKITGWTYEDASKPPGPSDEETTNEDYVTVLKKKHSKTGEESRFQGTILGIPAEEKTIKIDGGTFCSIQEWNQHQRHRAAELASTSMASDGDLSSDAKHDVSMTDG